MSLVLAFLDPKTISESQIDEVTCVLSKAFQDFNASVGAAEEIVEEEFGHPEMGPVDVRGICKYDEAYAVVLDNGKGGGKIVGVSFVDVHAKGSKVACLGPVASIAAGAGKKSFVAACAYAEKLGFSTLLLMQVAANSRSFSLYAKLGFEAKHTCQYLGGFLATSSSPEDSPPPPSGPCGMTLAVMGLEDVEECAQLFLAARGRGCGWDRRVDITGSLKSGHLFPMLVARDAEGQVVGYTTGFFINGHTVAKSQDIFCAMFTECSRLHQEARLPCPRFHCPVEFSGLLSWALVLGGLKIYRATIIMARGPYEHTTWPDAAGHVLAPSCMGY